MQRSRWWSLLDREEESGWRSSSCDCDPVVARRRRCLKRPRLAVPTMHHIGCWAAARDHSLDLVGTGIVPWRCASPQACGGSFSSCSGACLASRHPAGLSARLYRSFSSAQSSSRRCRGSLVTIRCFGWREMFADGWIEPQSRVSEAGSLSQRWTDLPSETPTDCKAVVRMARQAEDV